MKFSTKIIRNEQGTYTAICPTLPGCVTTGHSPEEASDKLDEAIRGYLAAVSDFCVEDVVHEVVEAH